MSGTAPPNTRVLRSNCRNHGTGSCTCPSHELPTTPRRSRSMSRTPSRASSVAPELTHSPSTEATSNFISNGSVTNLTSHVESYFQSNFNHQIKSQHTDEETVSRSVKRNILEEDYYRASSSLRGCSVEDDRPSHRIMHDDSILTLEQQKRQERSLSASPRLQSKHRMEKHTATARRRVIQSIIDEGEEMGDQDSDETTLENLNSSMASSLSSSFRSASAHERTRVNSSSHRMSTSITTTTSMLNGNHQAEKSHRIISVMRSGSVARDDDSFIHSRRGSSWETNSYIHHGRSYIQSAWSSIRNGSLYLPKLIYWSLVNSFVCEKWLLHQQSSPSSQDLCKKIFLPLLLLLLSACLYSFTGLFTQVFNRSAVMVPYLRDELQQGPGWNPTVAPVVHEGPNGILPSPNEFTSAAGKISEELQLHGTLSSSSHACPDLLGTKATYEKLLAKVSMLEKAAEDYKRSEASIEESYSSQLNDFRQAIELKIQELQKVEPSKTTVVIEKQTVVEKAVVAPPIEPEPINIEKISSELMPLLLPLIMDKVRAHVQEVKVDCPECKNAAQPAAALPVAGYAGFNVGDLDKMIKAAIAKYDADKTGLPDLALEPAGGTILSTRCTKSSQSKNSVLTLWGWRVWSFSNSPRTIIQPGAVPGECWVVEGATAEVVIQLISPAVITGFTLEHIPKAVSPYGKIDTAPRKFQVMGLLSEHDVEDAWDFGTFEYLDNNEPIQYFSVQNKTSSAYPIVELRVLSNHGSIKSTCIYRFRVHGENIERTT